MSFSVLPVKRYEANLGEYLTTVLEIQINNGRAISVDPVSSISSDYDGRLDFYMLGNMNKKVSILRKLINDREYVWLLAKSSDPKTHFPLNQELFIKQIIEWLQ